MLGRLASGELVANAQGGRAGTRDTARMWESILRMNATLSPGGIRGK